ncbi:hypothetical protein N7539_001667 [Penicillium diatomitis]|uniref:Uncharacterized protein n=1 Tax=Penicillium diatomitis TaxID=2819901 RepID=A0A9W9XH57_9EURO|nr:uncharacterized protein N7539_001667 [Penicillium diatomitis]KAJ5492921.1 hypothetical protein N7539_001667 [Penicillium diatomitis]
MAHHGPLTVGSQHVPALQELHAGDTFIVRFKNSSRNYNIDIWIGVLLPDNYDSGPALGRAPRGTRSASGQWDVDADQRIYPLYLPGRNLSRWIHIRDLFILGPKVPWIFAPHNPSRDNADEKKTYHTLRELVARRPKMEFLLVMAKKETFAKSKRGRDVKLVFPDNFDAFLVGLAGSTTEGESQYFTIKREDEEEQFSQNLEGHPPRKVRAMNSSFSDSRTWSRALRTSEDSETHTTLGEYALSSNLTFRRDTGAVKERNREPLTVETNTEAEEECVKVLFQRRWALSDMIEHVLLGKESSRQLLSIFQCVSSVNKSEREELVSFLKTKEFTPQLLRVSVSEVSEPDEARMFEIGDTLKVRREYQLRGVADVKGLCEQIIYLGKLYVYAKRLNMTELMEKITLKLQTAWNSYHGLSQLGPLLDVAGTVSVDSSSTDRLQAWLVVFIADTLDLIYYQCPKKYWDLMRRRPNLYVAVTKERANLQRQYPERFANPREQIQKRGVADFENVRQQDAKRLVVARGSSDQWARFGAPALEL